MADALSVIEIDTVFYLTAALPSGGGGARIARLSSIRHICPMEAMENMITNSPKKSVARIEDSVRLCAIVQYAKRLQALHHPPCLMVLHNLFSVE